MSCDGCFIYRSLTAFQVNSLSKQQATSTKKYMRKKCTHLLICSYIVESVNNLRTAPKVMKMDRFLSVLCCLVFVCYWSTTAKGETEIKTRSQIPVAVWKEINKLNSTEFLVKYLRQRPPRRPDADPGVTNVTDGEYEVNKTLTTRFEDEFFHEGAADENAAVAISYLSESGKGCGPSMKTVKLPRAELSDVIYIPDCITLQQCGGCCGHELLMCQPTRVEKVMVTVLQAEYMMDSGEFEFINIVDIEQENHLNCSCRCKIQPHDCDLTRHDYLADECRCRCKNEIEALACPSYQQWDAKLCKCVCRSVYLCHDDEYFSHQICGCAKLANVDSDSVDIEANPCLTVSCRAGYRAVPLANDCVCVVSDRWGGEAAGSFDPDDSPANVVEATTTTTEAPVRTRRPRPRPDRRRTIGVRGRPRGRRDAYIDENNEE